MAGSRRRSRVRWRATPASLAARAAPERACFCATCGGRIEGLPRDYAYVLPHCIWDLTPEEEARRARYTTDFAVLDDQRFFVRGLLPVPLEGGEEFRYGVWLEVSELDFHRIRRAWRDPRAYEALRFQARLANAIRPWGDRTLGLPVEVGTRQAGLRPYVVGSADPWLGALLRSGWDHATYQAIAEALQAPEG